MVKLRKYNVPKIVLFLQKSNEIFTQNLEPNIGHFLNCKARYPLYLFCFVAQTKKPFRATKQKRMPLLSGLDLNILHFIDIGKNKKKHTRRTTQLGPRSRNTLHPDHKSPVITGLQPHFGLGWCGFRNLKKRISKPANPRVAIIRN